MAEMRYMLDTNILSALAKNPQGPLFHRLAAHSPEAICTSIIVASEIQYGLHRGASAKVRQQMQAILSAIDILPLEAPADTHYGEIRAELEKAGQPISANDMFIAAHARSLGLTLVTHNVREFQRVPDLNVEDWLAEQAQ